MPKKIFISHSSADEEIVSLFVDLVLREGSGVDLEEIVYTSREDTGVVNGDDIPLAIRAGLKECALFFMMVSDNYRLSEVCLNEMGAAWMRDGIKRKIIVLPNAGFDKIGWLMSLCKGTKLDNPQGLDKIHDDVVGELGGRINTAAWNRSKESFLSRIKELEIDNKPVCGHSTPEALDFFEKDESRLTKQDIADRLLICSILFLSESEAINGALSASGKSLGLVCERAKSIKYANQVATSRKNASYVMTCLAEKIELFAPRFRRYYEQIIKYAIILKSRSIDSDEKDNIKKRSIELSDNLYSLRDVVAQSRSRLNAMKESETIESTSIERLDNAMASMLDILAQCISQTGELRIA